MYSIALLVDYGRCLLLAWRSQLASALDSHHHVTAAANMVRGVPAFGALQTLRQCPGKVTHHVPDILVRVVLAYSVALSTV